MSVEQQLSEIRNDIREMRRDQHDVLYGPPGQPEQGLVMQVQQLTRSAKWRRWAARAAYVALITAFGERAVAAVAAIFGKH